MHRAIVESHNKKSQKMTTHEFLQKLVGPIRPVGETTSDHKRLVNLAEYCAVASEMISEIRSIRDDFKNTGRRSEELAASTALAFLDNLKTEL